MATEGLMEPKTLMKAMRGGLEGREGTWTNEDAASRLPRLLL